MRILIAEDDSISCRILEAALIKWGYEVIPVYDGESAFAQLLEINAPKLAILDWEMPGYDGIEVCHKIRKIKTINQPYLIILSAKQTKKDISTGLDSGADDFIQKPFDFDELKSRINVGRRMVDLKEALRESEKFKGVLEMAGGVCHELNQPLQVILGASELLLMDMQENKTMQKNIKTIQKQIFRMGEITKKLMNITRYETKSYLNGKIVDLQKASE